MFLITLQEHPDGVYSVIDDEGDHVVYFFQEEDDAERYLGLLIANQDGEDSLPPLMTYEVDTKAGIGMCELRGMKYLIVEPDDIIVPPRSYDNLQDD
jgi:hypothetical protein